MALNDRDGVIAELAYRPQPDGVDLVGQRRGADDEHRASGRQLLREQVRGALRAGHDVGGTGRETEFAQMRGHLVGATGGVVGDEQLAGSRSRLVHRPHLRSARDREKRCHRDQAAGNRIPAQGLWRQASSLIRSSASVTSSTSALRRVQEPLDGLVLTAQRQQRFGVGVKQPRRGLSSSRRIRCRRRQHRQRLLELAQVGAGTGGHDAQFVGVVAGDARLQGRGQAPVRVPVDRPHVRSRRSAAAASTCCPSAAPHEVRPAPAPSRRSDMPRYRQPPGSRQYGPTGYVPPERAPTQPPDRRRAGLRLRRDAGRSCPRCSVEGGQFAADIRGKLFGIDVGRDTGCRALAICLRLSTPGAIRARTVWRLPALAAALTTSWSIASGAARGTG